MMKTVNDEFLELGLITWEGDNAVEYSPSSLTEESRFKKIKSSKQKNSIGKKKKK